MKQQTLEGVDTKPRLIPSRPIKRNDQQVKKIAVTLTTQLLSAPTPEEIDAYAIDPEYADSGYADVCNTLFEEADWDGYRLANRLEGHYGWDVDADTVEVLDTAEVLLVTVHEHDVREWVRNYELTPKYTKGAAVTITVKGKRYSGEITVAYPTTLQYLVYVEALGHVKEGLGVLGVVVNEDDIVLE